MMTGIGIYNDIYACTVDPANFEKKGCLILLGIIKKRYFSNDFKSFGNKLFADKIQYINVSLFRNIMSAQFHCVIFKDSEHKSNFEMT